jgi:hypothetical protein
MILNKDNILYYGNDGPELRLQSSLFQIRDFDDADYWYVDFFHGHHLAEVGKNIPTDVLSEIQAGNVTLLLNNSHESFHDVVEYIYLYFVDGLSIPAYNITLLSESAIVNEEVKVIANKYSLPEIKTEWIRIFEHNVHTVTTKTLNTLAHKPNLHAGCLNQTLSIIRFCTHVFLNQTLSKAVKVPTGLRRPRVSRIVSLRCQIKRAGA